LARRTRPRSKHAGSSRPGVSVSPTFVTAVVVVAGIVLRLWQYFANASLWLDEAALARNIIDRPALALFQPLDYAQVAPPGFLLMEKFFVTVFEGSEWALRLFPLLCGLSAIALFWRIASWTLTGWAVPYAVGLFALATPLVYFSSQVKQYSSDVAATTMILWAVMWLLRDSDGTTIAYGMRKPLIVALVGALWVWFSQPALFVLAGTGIALTLSSLLRGWPSRQSVLIVGIVWALSAGLAAALALRNVSPSDRAYLDWYWSSGFMPIPPRSPAEALWIWHHFTWLFGAFAASMQRSNGGLGYPWSPVFVILAIVGFIALWRRGRTVAMIQLTPVLLALMAAALRMYPFSGRVVSFLLPNVILAAAAGVDHSLRHWPQRLQFASPLLLALAVGSPLYAAFAALPPERIEHLRPVLMHIEERLQPQDEIYVYYPASLAFLYYAPRVGLDDFVLGRCSASEPRAYLRDLDEFRGRTRVWIVATHVRFEGAELRGMLGYLDSIGTRMDSFEVRSTSNDALNSAYGFLYDLSDKTRLLNASADTYTFPALHLDEAFDRWACYGTQSTLGRF
jgi:hypothetical protein